jgi:hypothetical protein
LFREREPGMRSDLYRVYDDDVWSAIMNARLPVLEHFVAGIEEAIALVGSDSPGGHRLVETREFFCFMQREMAQMLDRWQQERQRLFSSER